MKKTLFILLTVMLSVCINCTTVLADPVGDTGTGNPPPPPPTHDIPPNIDVDEPPTTHCSCTPLQQYQTYVPKVTELRSLNAMLAKNGNQVYFVPKLDEFPISLANTVLTLKDGAGKSHNFAVVCGEYFDTDVTYVRVDTNEEYVSEVQTSKLVFSKEDSSRCLNLLGYDLLLSEEHADITNTNGKIDCYYYVTKVGTSQLTAKTAIMDLYKAVGQYDWDIKLTYVKPEANWNINESHILSHISFLTSGSSGNMGLDTSEEQTYVFATRTNPDLYWERAKRDAIFGGAHNATSDSYVGSETSVSKSFSQSETITMGEFCSLARAIMTLYGEPVMTELERNAALQLYGVSIPQGSLQSEEEYDAVMYLAAKGIIDPKDTNFNANITFADIEPILLRIADTDSRLTIKDAANLSNILTASGYTEATVRVAPEMSVDIYDKSKADWYDYLIECTDGTTFIVKPQDKSEASVYINDSSNGQITTIGPNKVILKGDEQNTNKGLVSAQGVGIDYKLNDTANFVFEGIEQYDDKAYYHFKINPASALFNQDTISVTYTPQKYNGSTETLITSSSFTIGNNYTSKGGVYTLSNGNFVHQTFEEANFTSEFVDGNYLNLKGKSATRTGGGVIVAVTLPSYLLTKDNLSNVSDTDFDFGKLLDNNGTLRDTSTGTIQLSTTKNVTASIFANAANGSDVVRIEFSCDKASDITNTGFFTSLATLGTKNEYKGFYRASDNSLLVSYNYLKSLNLVSGITELKDSEGYVITLSKYKSNVILYTKDDKNYVMVGDTIYGNINNETLVQAEGGDYLINYRAIIGWANNVKCVSTGDGSIVATTLSSMGSSYSVNYTTKEVFEIYPYSTNNYMWTDFNVASVTTDQGFSLSGSFPLASYCVVMADENNSDYLFVWHRNGVCVDGNEINVPEDKDAEARSKFQSLTNIKLDKQKSYSLCMFTLHRSNQGNPKGFRYKQVSQKTQSNGKQVVSFGWLYNPPEYTDMQQAIKDYANSASMSGNAELVIPIVEYSNKFYDVNLNTCASAPGNKQLDVGILPYRFTAKTSRSNANRDSLCVVKSDGSFDITKSAGDVSVDNFIIYTAPVASFAQLKCMGNKTVGDIRSGSLYFGTALAQVSGKDVLICNNKTSFSTKDKAVCTYYGITTSTVYAVTAEYSSIGVMVEDVEETLETIYDDPAIVVDWGAYTFHRLVNNVDAWSTIVMIFALNILPRVAMLLFFTLMLLSLIKNVKPWRTFCQNHFDVYSFLTLGHQSVDTVDTKRLCFISLICLSIFMVIMDGQLFNFIIFIAKWIIAIYQH